jgi:hypothetical protein
MSSVIVASRLKRAELASSLGAGLLGAGLGILVAPYIADLALLVLVVGALMHGWGMYDKRAIERDLGRPEASWMKALYWLCWAVLTGLGLLLAFRVLY